MRNLTWVWDQAKSLTNKAKHKLSFELAVLVFEDPYHVSMADPCDEEERWRTYGAIQGVIILVVHTDPVMDGNQVVQSGRIISARKATPHERRLYEEARYG